MNDKKLSDAQYYTYEARKKDLKWLQRTIELLLEQPERGRNEETGELFTNETIEVARKSLELMETEQPESKDISELYKLLKFYKAVRNSDWDNICTHVEIDRNYPVVQVDSIKPGGVSRYVRYR